MIARVLVVALLAPTLPQMAEATAVPLPSGATHVNSIGLRLARVEPGRFRMGFEGEPLHPEILTRKGHFRHGDLD